MSACLLSFLFAKLYCVTFLKERVIFKLCQTDCQQYRCCKGHLLHSNVQILLTSDWDLIWKNGVGLIHLISFCPNVKGNPVEQTYPMHFFSHVCFAWGICNEIKLTVKRENKGIFLLSQIHSVVFLKRCEILSKQDDCCSTVRG